MVVVPPKLGGTTQLLSCEPGLVLVKARGGEEFKFGFDRTNPCVGVERVFRLVEGRGLRAQEVFITSNLRLLMSPPSMGLLLLPVGNVPQQLSLSRQDGFQRRWERRWGKVLPLLTAIEHRAGLGAVRHLQESTFH